MFCFVLANLSLSVIEIGVLFFCSLLLGAVIHFFLNSSKSFKSTSIDADKFKKQLDEWKLRYFNDTEHKEREISAIRKQLKETEENSRIYAMELEDAKRQQKKIYAEYATVSKQDIAEGRGGYFEQLELAQSSLLEHNEKINQLLVQIDFIKEKEEKEKEILQDNEELHNHIRDLQSLLHEKENEITKIRQESNLTQEMSSMLDNAYSEFNLMQEKMKKLENQLNNSKLANLEYEDLKEAHYRTVHDLEELKLRNQGLIAENQQLMSQLHDTEDRLKDTSFQRQQLQKRVNYLEELNYDLQTMSEANKKLEGQIKRIGELESRLHLIAEERDLLLRKQVNGF